MKSDRRKQPRPDASDRRQHQRLGRPFEGSWQGASGANKCRISDLSIGGCFVETLAAPTSGEQTRVTILLGADHSMTFSGKVVYVEPRMGFAVKFHELSGDGLEQLQRMFDALTTPEHK
ncbi:MAG TPA: PilZ domain-containing protein [Vicinamibacterales bacterium]|nr:PilZ domain-containing protein [Vicinamibacterales bacterium]